MKDILPNRARNGEPSEPLLINLELRNFTFSAGSRYLHQIKHDKTEITKAGCKEYHNEYGITRVRESNGIQGMMKKGRVSLKKIFRAKG